MARSGIFLFAWLIGLLIYIGVLVVIWQHVPSSGDLSSVAMYSFLAFAPCFIVIFMPVMEWILRTRSFAKRRWIPIPVGFLLGVAPFMAFLFLLGGSFEEVISGVFSEEMSLLLYQFLGTGFGVGVGYAVLGNRVAA